MKIQRNARGKISIGLIILLSLLVTTIRSFETNVGGDGTSYEQAMEYYLVGEPEVYPNLQLLLWNEVERADKTHYGELYLHGQLALRVDDWINFDENALAYDDRLIEFGWSFRNDTNNPIYDGVKATFLYNTEHTNDPTKKGYSRTF